MSKNIRPMLLGNKLSKKGRGVPFHPIDMGKLNQKINKGRRPRRHKWVVEPPMKDKRGRLIPQRRAYLVDFSKYTPAVLANLRREGKHR